MASSWRQSPLFGDAGAASASGRSGRGCRRCPGHAADDGAVEDGIEAEGVSLHRDVSILRVFDRSVCSNGTWDILLKFVSVVNSKDLLFSIVYR